ncbi:MAG: ABC transporter substrate-binding protein [Dehalococcoidales bacterium]|nr:ABC transporter substrate-binding protein [Dehalococcoidales bacterium]
MKKLQIGLIALVLVVLVVFGIACKGGVTTSNATTTTTTSNVTTTTSAPGGPVYGGTLRIIENGSPTSLGYPPDFGMVDGILAAPVLETLCRWGKGGIQVPVLATSWDIDTDNPSITWHLRQGVQFHDGTPWNAEACRWNFQKLMDAGRMSDGQYVKSLEVINEYTIKMNLTAFNWLMIENYGWSMMISPTAFENAGTNDEERMQWARNHPVGTGAFKFVEYQRDVVLKYDRNDNYWDEGLPYLDALECIFISSPETAAAMMEAGEADMFLPSRIQDTIKFEEMGYKTTYDLGMMLAILPDSSNPDSPFAKKEVREAVEYALNRPAIAEMMGMGKYEPLHQLASSKWPGYVEDYDPRPYNTEKAMQLLADAGYPTGFHTKLLGIDSDRDTVAIIQSALGKVGIIVDPDIADMGRWAQSLFGTGWDGLAIGASGINPDASDLFVHYGANPMTFRTGNFYKSPEYLSLCEEALNPRYLDATGAMDTIKEAVRQAGEDVMVIPLWVMPSAVVFPTYVHSDYFTIHGNTWTPQYDWMDPH